MLDGAVASASLDPHIPGAQPVAQFRQDAEREDADGVDGLPAASMCHDAGSLTIRRRPPI
jgi:hypothetical protein